MKKIVLIMLILLSCSVVVQAKDDSDLEVYGGISYNSYDFKYHNNIVDTTEFIDIEDSKKSRGDKVEGGVGYYLGLKKWIWSNWALGLEVEDMETETDILYIHHQAIENESADRIVYNVNDFGATTNGLLITATYDFPLEVTEAETYFLAGLGVYNSDFNYKVNLKRNNQIITRKLEDNKKTVGIKLGLGNKHQISDNILLNGRVLYRYANIDSEFGEKLYQEGIVGAETSKEIDHNIIDYSGLEASLAVELKF